MKGQGAGNSGAGCKEQGAGGRAPRAWRKAQGAGRKAQGLEAEIVACRRCPRLVEHREAVAREKKREFREWDYWGKPVPGFGDLNARVLLVGLAPAAH